MVIDFEKMQAFERRLNEIIGELTYQKEKLKEAIKLMRMQNDSSVIIESFKKSQEKLDAQILTAMKMKEAVKRVSAIYRSGEERICSFIDEGLREKCNFKCCTYISDNTDFEWSIK